MNVCTPDFSEYRKKWNRPGVARSPLLKAVGKVSPEAFIVDATAGLGRESYLLATTGATVLGCERSALLYSLLEKSWATEREKENSLRLSFQLGDAKDILSKLVAEQKRPDIIYLDPMVHATERTALVKKDMQFLRTLLSPDTDAEELLRASRKTALKRVVVKRPFALAPLDKDVSYSLKLKNTRYDIYLLPDSKGDLRGDAVEHTRKRNALTDVGHAANPSYGALQP